jgi:ribonuclease R
VRVRVQVSRVDLDGRKIDFRMVREGDGERLLARGRSDRAERVERPATAVEELGAIREADRTVKAVSRERKAEAAKRSRKPGARKTTPRARTRR